MLYQSFAIIFVFVVRFIITPSVGVGVGRVVRRCWVNFQCWGVLLIWIIVEQGPIVLTVGAGGGCLDIFSLICHFSFLSPSLWETARYRLKYCLKGPLSPNNQPTFCGCLGWVGWVGCVALSLTSYVFTALRVITLSIFTGNRRFFYVIDTGTDFW